MNKDVLKSDEPLVSVVLCFYNEEMFLEESIQSVMSQSYLNWELVLVDDGSTDASSEIAKGYSSRHPGRIFYIEHAYHQSNGLSASRNAGIRKCRGRYVAFLEAGDVWFPEKLSRQIQIFHTHPVSVVVGASVAWNSWRDYRKSDSVIPMGVGEGIYRSPHLMLALYPLGKGAAPCLSAVIVHRAVLRRCSFEELFRGMFEIYSGHAFLSKVYLQEAVFVSAACHCRHRQDTIILAEANHSGNYHKVRSYYLYWLRDYLHSQPFRYKSVEHRVRRAQMPYREPILYRLLVDFPTQVRSALFRVLTKFRVVGSP